MKLKGNALYYSIIILLISSSTTGLILLKNYYRSTLITDAIVKKQLHENVLSAFRILCGGEDLFKGMEHINADIFDDGKNIVALKSCQWGAFQIATATSSRNNYTITRTVLLGTNLAFEEPISLFMPDEGRILSFSGSTLIRGVSYLPKGTARSASIEGFPFSRPNLTEGEIKSSGSVLPALTNDLFSFADHYIENGFGENDSVIDLQSLDSRIVNNSFTNKTLIVLCDENSDLSNFSFSGKIILWSKSEVSLTAKTELMDVILFAPSIMIKDEFSGSFQAYALQSITVGNNCILQYPTFLNVIQSDGKYTHGDSLKVIIKGHSFVNGGIILRNKGMSTYMRVDENAVVNGQVYVPGYTELSGKINGSLWCKNFFLQTQRGRYENHLLNCTIDRKNLPSYFSGVELVSKNPYKSVIKWLR